MRFQIPFLCFLCLASLFGCKEGTIVYDLEFPRADSDEAQWGGYCSVNSLEQGSGLDLLSEMSEMTPLLSSETDRLVLDGAANSYLAQARLGGNQGPRLEKYGRFGEAQWSRQVAAQQEIHAFGLSVDMFGNSHTHYSQAFGGQKSDLDVVLARYDTNGAERWVRTLSSPADEVVLGSRVTRRGDLLATGFTFGELESFVASSACNFGGLVDLDVEEDKKISNVNLGSQNSFSSVTNTNTNLATVQLQGNKLKITLKANKNSTHNGGPATITVNASGCSPPLSKQITLTVNPVNDEIGDRKNNEEAFTNAGDNFTCESALSCFTNSDLDAADGGLRSDWSIKIGEGPSNGTAGITTDGYWWYKPDDNFTGRDYFTTQVTDNHSHTNEREVCVASTKNDSDPILRCQNKIADATDNNTKYSLNEDNEITKTLYFLDDSDQPLTYRIINLGDNGTNGYFKTANGTAWLSDAVQKDNSTKWTYRPDTNFNGDDSFVVEFADDAGNKNYVEVVLKVDAVNDKPTASDASATVIEDNQSSIDNLSGNDIDDNNNILSFSKISDPSYGIITNFSSSTGSFNFTPFDNLSAGTYLTSFNYTVKYYTDDAFLADHDGG